MRTAEIGDEIRLIKTKEGWAYYLRKKGRAERVHAIPTAATLKEALQSVQKLVEDAYEDYK